jgi:hypothetical protein
VEQWVGWFFDFIALIFPGSSQKMARHVQVSSQRFKITNKRLQNEPFPGKIFPIIG